jgi:hypothetical protein
MMQFFYNMTQTNNYLNLPTLTFNELTTINTGIGVADAGGIIGIGVSRDLSRMVVATYSTRKLYFAVRTSNNGYTAGINPTWGTLTEFYTHTSAIYRVALSEDGNRGVFCSNPGLVFYFVWNGSTYTTPVQTLATTSRSYYGLGMTYDGSRIIASSNNEIIFASWNGTNYSTFTAVTTPGTPGGGVWMGIGISGNGDRIVVGDNLSTWYLSFWTGSNYGTWTTIRTLSGVNTRNACFNRDASVVFLSYINNTSFTVEYAMYIAATNTYDGWTAVSSSIIPASLDAHGTCFVGDYNGQGGYLFVTSYLVTSTMYICQINNVPNNIGTATQYAVNGTYATGNNSIGISLSQDELKILFAGFQGGLYYSTRANKYSSWNTFTQVAGSPNPPQFYHKVALTSDGTRGVVCITNSFVYFFNWTGSVPSGWTQTLDNIRRDYTGLAMTSDGSRIVVCSDSSGVLFASWNGTNYTAFTRTLDSIIRYIGVGISSNGDRIVYGTIDSQVWLISYWNGTNYPAGTIFRKNPDLTSTSQYPRTAYFSEDSSILFLSYNGNAVGSVEYGYFNSEIGNYDLFNYIQPNFIPSSRDLHGLCYKNGNLYSTYLGTTTIFVTTIYPEYPTPFTIGRNGITFSCWIRSNSNQTWTRIFDFGNGAGKDNILIGLDSALNDLTFSTYVTTSSGRSNNQPHGLFNNNPINDNNWYHFAFTLGYTGANSPTANYIIYLNGNAISNTNFHFYPAIVRRLYNYIGKSNWSNDGQYFGAMKDLRFYNTVLSAAQIASIYQNIPISNPVSDYTQRTIYIVSLLPVNRETIFGTSPTTMGTNLTYYYWIEPNACINSLNNLTNPINFSYTYNNTGAGQNIRLFIVCNNTVTLKVTGNNVTQNITLSSTSVNVASVPATNVTIFNGNNTFDFFCINTDGRGAFAAYVTDNAGNYLFSTNYNKQGWTAKITGFFINQTPFMNI